MKRHRILFFDFDSRASSLGPIPDSWDEKVKKQHIANKEKTIEGLKCQYGTWGFEQKLQNFIELKVKPFSVAAFHNKFLQQARDAYVIGAYYPALTASCSLGERILNHMMILLRDYHKDSSEYKKIHKKQSFDHWPQVIDALESWGELLPEASNAFRELHSLRNRSIHFIPDTDRDDKQLSLAAIQLIQEIVQKQFCAFGRLPWYFIVPGEVYIKKGWEEKPIVKHIFIPNSLLVGPKHKVEQIVPTIIVNDQFDYEDIEITDDEFIKLRTNK